MFNFLQMNGYFGRTIIYSDVEEVTSENILTVVQKAYQTHQTNQAQIEFLYGYYKGNQDIYQREKKVRPDIDYKVVENYCKEVVEFKSGYSIGAPIQYNDRTGEHPDEINELNTIMDYEGRSAVDEETVEWNLIAGTAYKIGYPKEEKDEISNIEIASLDPRETFVIYSSGMWKTPLAAVWFKVDSENNTHFHVYTPNEVFKLLNFDSIEERGTNIIGKIPIVEFPANNARLGAFEPILDLQDVINTTESDRANAISQFVQSLIVTTNCDFEEGVTAADMVEAGIVNLTSKDGLSQAIQILTSELNQSQTQTYKDNLYDAICTICSLPQRNKTSNGDTGIAVVYRDGWSAAETAANKYEAVYKRSENKFLDICMAVFDAVGGPHLSPSDIEVTFTRKNYENIAQKVEVLDKMLNNPKIAPRLAYLYCTLFPDPEEAYKESLPFIEAANSNAIDNTTTEKSEENAG